MPQKAKRGPLLKKHKRLSHDDSLARDLEIVRLRLAGLTTAGIQGLPKVERKGGAVTIEAPGVRLNWKGVEVETEGVTIKAKVGSRTG